MSRVILVAIGANLPDAAGRPALETCRWAAAQLDGLCGCRLRGLSRWYETAPVPASDQPSFVNGLAHLAGDAEPRVLLAALHGVEEAAGRVRGIPNAARVLDLDLIGMDDLVINAPDIVVPHPRAASRGFVLAPLCDVAPGWRCPGLDQTVRELLAGTPMAGVRPFACLAPVRGLD